MRKSFELENLECANCAAKMERDISAFPEVKKCTITFMTSRMSITVDDNADLNDVLDRAQKVLDNKENATETDLKLAEARLHRALVRKNVASFK